MNLPIYRAINNREIKELSSALQIFSDCYMISSIRALTKTKGGQNILKNNIKISEDGNEPRFKIKFHYPKNEDIFVTQTDITLLQLTDKYKKAVLTERVQLPIIKAIEIAMNKLINAHPSVKPFLCRFADCNEKFEYNLVSNFMRIFTDQKPYSLNEKTLKMSLTSHKKEAYDLFERLGDEKEFSFVAGTGIALRKDLANFHCYLVDSVDLQKRTVNLSEPRTDKLLSFGFDEAIKSLKYFTGFFKGDLINH